ncbi:UDP-glycosyltransferase 73B4 [Linum grandiflorum]
MAQGHMIPIVDMARLFSRRGVKSTIITTPLNAAGLPEGCENVNAIKSPDMLFPFFMSMHAFRQPVEQLLKLWKPDCIVADLFFPWATQSAHSLGIPRLFFNGTSSFAICLMHCFTRLPHRIEFTKLQLPPFWKGEGITEEWLEMRDLINRSEETSFGAVVNSFHELEPGYSEHYREVVGTKAWFIGPLSLSNKGSTLEKAERGKTAAIDGHECLKASGQGFIWVVKRDSEEEKDQEWLPEGFEERMEGKGLVIKGWAPQVLILDHEATGGFMTHCGWNSTLEGVAAGVPMVTWPLGAEQFLNGRLVTDVLRVGVGIGCEEWSREDRKMVVGREEIERAVSEVMVGEDAEEMRERAMELKVKAVKANEEGGSSYSDLKSLLEELVSVRDNKDVDLSSCKL